MTKQNLFEFCRAFADHRIARIQDALQSVHESLFSETKSSAGDKHETGRAMLQLELEKLGRQLAEAEKMKVVLGKIDQNRKSKVISLGSWVKTTKGDYFLAISAGEFKNEDISIFCISTGTPIGRLLMGKSIDDTVVFNNREIRILDLA